MTYKIQQTHFTAERRMDGERAEKQPADGATETGRDRNKRTDWSGAIEGDRGRERLAFSIFSAPSV